ALNNATLSFILALANHGVKEALVADSNLLNGLNVYRGELVSPEVATSQNRAFSDRHRLLSKH
ncbi:MAG: alanine dehydrogenase, partial [Thalassolituus sp.]|nr:alanine dehydrogenase [Thalassolituus sp.]